MHPKYLQDELLCALNCFSRCTTAPFSLSLRTKSTSVGKCDVAACVLLAVFRKPAGVWRDTEPRLCWSIELWQFLHFLLIATVLWA